MAATKVRTFRIDDDLYDGARDTLAAVDEPMHVAVKIGPGQTLTDAVVELCRTLAEDVPQRRHLHVV